MGLKFRKSINLGGGFRINLSKNGVGYSWGVPGYRITKTAKGTTRKTYSIPGTGISYTDESSKRKSSTKTSNSKQNISLNNGISAEKALDIGDIASYQTAEYSELLEGIKNYKRWNFLSNILIATIFLIQNPLFLITVIAGILLKIYIRKHLVIPMEYIFDEDSEQEFTNLKEKWNSLTTSKALWQITSSAKVLNQKHYAGAGNLVKRQKISIFEATPKYFKSNVKFLFLNLANERLYLMPDKILIEKGFQVGAISYQDVKITCSEYRFIEDETVPKDATVVGHTWLKVNKNGSPDKRFKGNRQIPICNYGKINITSNTGMNILISFSNNSLIEKFNR